jgi:hypothetical protein
MATSKVSAIQENTAEKMELIDFFKKKEWDSVPGIDMEMFLLSKYSASNFSVSH